MEKNLLIVGAHCGDGELQAGAIANKYAKAGYHVTFLHLTAGEKGNPPGMSVEEYRKQKIEESEACAKVLGADSMTLDYRDAELTFSDEIITRIAKCFRKLKPALVITHWVNSMHPDHALCPRLVNHAWLKAALPGFDLDGLPPHGMKGYLHSENWEDMEGYVPDIFIDVSDEFNTYLEALSKYWFIMHSKDFRYYDYYKALGTIRGCRIKKQYAQTLKYPAGGNVRVGQEIPGLSL
ncbi:PIG-L deacetylase family protein [Sporolactobacillus sp. THM19-2]|uniref:PIG-L deacetylase family protein n=1 Tax=Sporolactobacillus sp. THM19-2 TaxID=2511171 RepID=UPI00101EC1EE|nr:PIG-L family deacetylase [Sporolactobacillus sp. THM19-2]RYL94482.1 PIG-L family deacetylase [Sporolactobacillus sp. THM19-2]